jgi:predicted acyl esterase
VIVTTFPRAVRVIEHTLIPLKDGTTLAARIWLPEDAEQNPVPAILEYLPYRKRDGTYERDALTHPYLAGHGYAGVRVDMVAVNRRACCSTSTPSRNKTMAWS